MMEWEAAKMPHLILVTCHKVKGDNQSLLYGELAPIVEAMDVRLIKTSMKSVLRLRYVDILL